MLTLAYCRVSTEEQAEEGFSIEGQTDKLRSYASLRDLGPVTVIIDGGLSGKNLDRPGLQQLLAAVELGHVSHVILWRLDRLSRNLADLIMLANKFIDLGVTLHSVSENLDVSSASGRMYYNILGSFAQFYREQLSENVKMGIERAVKEGHHLNRAKFGYDKVDKKLVPNSDALRVREMFRLRGEGMSYRDIGERTGVLYSTVRTILESRVYCGEVLHKGLWYPGLHEWIITEDEYRAAHRGFPKGVQRSKDVLSGHVLCGLCEKRMAINQNGLGSLFYKCHHRGVGCSQPARSNKGLSRAAVLGMALLGQDERLQAAMRRELGVGRRTEPDRARRRRRTDPAQALAKASEQRRKLLELYFEGKISADGFQEAEQRLCADIEAARSQAAEVDSEDRMKSDLEIRFEEVARILSNLDIGAVWDGADHRERRVLVEELVEWVKVFPDHLEVKISGCLAINVLYGEVGLKESENVQIGGPT